MKNTALVLILAIVSVAAGVVIYRVGPALNPETVAIGPITQPSTATASTVGGGFSFNPLDQPQVLPDLRFMNDTGSELTLADFQGKLVLLNIWATWCGPCRKEMPTLDRLQTKLGGRGFEVVALSIDTEIEIVQQFFAELGLAALRIYIDETVRAPVNLNVLGVPATLLIDRQGREIGRVLGPAEWDSDEVVAAIRYYLDSPVATITKEE